MRESVSYAFNKSFIFIANAVVDTDENIHKSLVFK